MQQGEYIRFMAKNHEFTHNSYLRSFDDVGTELARYTPYADVYIGLSTSNSESGQQDAVFRRKTVMLDFDKKDYPTCSGFQDFAKMIKKRIGLYYHAAVDTGGGYHFYYGIEETSDCERVTTINRELAELVGADLKAAIITQMDRLPTSRNHKYEPPKPVSVIVNDFGTTRYRPYSLNRLEQLIRKAKHNLETEQLIQQQSPKECSNVLSFYCVQAMIATGAKAGERNFCLGRICNFLRDIRSYTYNKAYDSAQEFNSRCSPPKPLSELKAQFDLFWNDPSYKLLGCSFKNEAKMNILSKYCDKTLCNNATVMNNNVVEAPSILMNNRRLRRDDFKRMRGNHYLVLTVLHYKNSGLTRKEIEFELTPRKGKCVLSRNTLSGILNDLLLWNQAEYDSRKKVYKLVDIAEFGMGRTQYYYSAALARISGIISQQEYLVYLGLVKCLQQNKNASYEELSILTWIDKGNIPRYIAALSDAHMLHMLSAFSVRGE